MSNRRTFLQSAFAALFATPTLSAQMQMDMPMSKPKPRSSALPPQPFTPVYTTEVGDLPYTVDGATKVFHLVAEVVKQPIHPDKTIDAWGFNGSAPGPTIQVLQGDHVRVIFDNHLPEPSSIHWHGFEDQVGYDGMPAISQDPVPPGGRFVYEFDIHQAGTFFYHSHMAMQEMMGMLGGFIMHPRTPYHPHCDKDFLLHLQEYAVLPSSTIPNTAEMEYNWLLINGKAGPATTPLIIRQGDRVRIRFVNLGMDHHPMHLHGNTFQVTGTEGGRIPETAWWPGNTVLVGVAQARDVEFVADRPGDWMLHCHLPHHMMNQMSSRVMGTPTTNGPLGDPSTVPGFPQDAYMEGPMMAMDAMFEKPENYGLKPGWSGYMQGMMTFVRVLPPDKYATVTERMRQGA
jgi:FtsP/CotA-like multicopper oxidase with cupredoxin domain